MRIRYTKPGGREVDMDDGPARRLIASGQAEAVEAEDQSADDTGEAIEEPSGTSTSRRAAAKTTSRRSR